MRFENNIKEWVKRQKRRLENQEISPSYFEKIESISTKYLIPFFQSKDLREIRTSDIVDFQMFLPMSLKPKTIKNILYLLQKYLNDCYDMEIIKVKPKIPKIDVPDPLWNWCNEEEQEFIYKYIPDQNKPVFLFMILHDTHPGEARAIHREDLDLKNGTCLIRRSFANDIYRTTTKTRKQRLIPLHPDIIPVLKNIPVVKGFLFLDPKTNESYKKCRLWRIFN